MKGAAASEELQDATKAVKLLGAVLQEEHEFLLPVENSERHIFIFKKEKQTPKKYPRKAGVPNKTPITG